MLAIPRPAQVPDTSRRARRGFAGLGRGLDPGWRDGRSPSRRPGGPPPKRWQRRPTPRAGHDADSAAKPDGLDERVAGGRRENIRRLAT